MIAGELHKPVGQVFTGVDIYSNHNISYIQLLGAQVIAAYKIIRHVHTNPD